MLNNIAGSIVKSVEQVLVGKTECVELSVIAMLSGGHLLLDDVPGVGKTTLAVALAAASGCDFGRIQFTPDTMPSDITGISIYNPKTGDFSFRQGAAMTNILLADEINRTPPKTQSALLEAMNEGQITVDGTTYQLPQPFFVIATQNPVEQLGTYSLPEAQMDRFMMRISIGYPDKKDELRMLDMYASKSQPPRAERVTDRETLIKMREEVKAVRISDELSGYIIDVVSGTRSLDDVLLGASPRASIALSRAAQGAAYLAGRDYVTPDDVKKIVLPVLTHRLVVSPSAKARKQNADTLLRRFLHSVSVPV